MAERTRELLARFDDGSPLLVPDRPDPPEAGSSGVPDPAEVRRGPARWRRLAARVPVRLDPGRRAALSVGVAVVVAAVATGVWLLSSQPQPMSVSTSRPPSAAAMPALGSTSSSADPTAAGPASVAVSTPPSLVVVDVAGKVRRPGLYRLAPDSRVDDAVRAAGGPLPGVDLRSLNLAARVVDGQQILVGPGAALPPAAGTGSAGSSGSAGGSIGADGPVNLNSADLAQLETLPGVGPVLAQHILDWRGAHGSFQSVDQLNDVTGIGDVKFAALKPLVTV